jgi:serine/threonine protein kinase
LDVKPSNFFVRECGSLALGDFGQAVEISKIQKLRDDDVEGDSVFMAPELLQTIIPPAKRITTKADIFSLGASLLEITLGINLPHNGVMWQKLRQAGEG